MPINIRRANLPNAIALAMAACYAVKMLCSMRSSRRSKRILERGREITATTRRAYA